MVVIHAFEEGYNRTTCPILADHCALVHTFGNFKLMVASAAEANSEKKGWLNKIHLDLKRYLEDFAREGTLHSFSEDIGRPYTKRWGKLIGIEKDMGKEKAESILKEPFETWVKSGSEGELKKLEELYDPMYRRNYTLYAGAPAAVVYSKQEWYNNAIKSTKSGYPKEIDPERAYKLNQAGSLFKCQPTGGFIMKEKGPYSTLEDMVQQYVKAMRDNEAHCMIINEGFVDDDVFKRALAAANNGGTAYTYRRLKEGTNAILYCDTCRVEVQTENRVTITHGGQIIKVAVVHENSQNPSDKATFMQKIENWKKSGVHIVCGDSNLTEKKLRNKGEDYATIESIRDKLEGTKLIKASVLSEHSISKDRWERDIILNNQFTKKGTTEKDGMFIFQMTPALVSMPHIASAFRAQTLPSQGRGQGRGTSATLQLRL